MSAITKSQPKRLPSRMSAAGLSDLVSRLESRGVTFNLEFDETVRLRHARRVIITSTEAHLLNSNMDQLRDILQHRAEEQRAQAQASKRPVIQPSAVNRGTNTGPESNPTGLRTKDEILAAREVGPEAPDAWAEVTKSELKRGAYSAFREALFTSNRGTE